MDMISKADEINYFESFLGMETSNFEKVNLKQNDLRRYIEFWEFAEKWKFQLEQWSSGPLI